MEASNATHFASNTWNSIPVAVFIGGTSGIGEAMVHSFAKYTNGKASIAIVGRNKDAGERILSELPKPDGQGPYERLFIQCDVSLMRNVPPVVQQLTSTFTKINYLIISTGYLDIGQRVETQEGLEYRLAVSYYSRWLFIKELVGLVQKAREDGEDATVLSILAAGYGGEVDQTDWEIRNNYSSFKSVFVAASYNDLMVESFAQRYPSIPFVHAHPGMVRTPIFRKSPTLVIKFMGLLVHTIGRLFTISAGQSSEAMWNVVLSVDEKGGSYRMHVGKNLEKNVNYFGTEENRDGLWEHTESAISRSLTTQI